LRLVTTHDWASPLDVDHLDTIRREQRRFAVGGVTHLALEVLAYALDEAAEGTTRRVIIRCCADGSVLITDDGRGTDTRAADDGVMMVKPIMATADLRFFDVPSPPVLPDGQPRCGMSVVAALSSWVEHTNVRANGAWVARYERGWPVGVPRTLPPGRPTGTTVHLRPDPEVFGDARVDVGALERLVESIDTPASIAVRADGPAQGR